MAAVQPPHAQRQGGQAGGDGEQTLLQDRRAGAGEHAGADEYRQGAAGGAGQRGEAAGDLAAVRWRVADARRRIAGRAG
jgi:hypothetical protein